jgi:hypothetical protein
MVSESRILSGGSGPSAAKDALLLSFRAFDLAIVAAVQSGLPLGEWFRCALVHMAGKAQGAGEHEIVVAGSALVTLAGEPTPHPEPVSEYNPSQDLVKQTDSALEAAQNRINELCDALQGLLNISDTKRVTDLAEVKRLVARAKEVLLASRQIGRWHETGGPSCGSQNQRIQAA